MTAPRGVDWSKATEIGYVAAALAAVRVHPCRRAAHRTATSSFAIRRSTPSPKGDAPPPWWIRGLLILTCTGVSFAHGSNDGQKGMGLIMLILIGTVPTAYALNRAMPESQMIEFRTNSAAASRVIASRAAGYNVLGDPRPAVTAYVSQRKINEGTFPSLAVLVSDIAKQVDTYGSLAKVPSGVVRQHPQRHVPRIGGDPLPDEGQGKRPLDRGRRDPDELQEALDNATKFIPTWVKVAVAIALGLGTMIGWKRIVVTVGEKIGKTHLTYAQGASAELVAASTIGAADYFGLPVSTTHVLSSGVAGTMAANGSGLQWSTVRNLLMAWVLTLPAAILLSGSLYWIFSSIF